MRMEFIEELGLQAETRVITEMEAEGKEGLAVASSPEFNSRVRATLRRWAQKLAVTLDA